MIPSGWTTAEFGELVELSRKRFDPQQVDHQAKCIELEHISQVTGRLIGYTDSTQLVSSKNQFQRGDVLFGKLRPYLRKYWLCEFDGVCSSEIWVFTSRKDKCDSKFLFYLVQTDRFIQVANVSSGSKMPRADWDFVSESAFDIPPLLEQRKIAEILSTWDKAILLLEELVATEQKRRQALLQQLLTGRQRFREFFGSWQKVSLVEVVTPVSRQESVSPGEDYRLIGVRWYVEGAHIHDVVPGSQIATKSLSRVQENDILYNKMWVTKSAFGIARKEHDGAYGSTEYPQFRAQEDRLDVNFLGYLFHDPKFQYQATRLCKGTTGRARLSLGDFLEIEIQLPEINEQRKIVAVLQACDTELNLQTQKLMALKRQKQGLMQQLLTGRVRVKTG